MGVVERVQAYLGDLQAVLETVSSDVGGAVTPGSAEIVGVSEVQLSVHFPALSGTIGNRRMAIMFSIVSDFHEAVSGRAFNKSSLTEDDYLHPFVQIYVYRQDRGSFSLCIAPEHRDVVTKFMSLLGMAPREIEIGWPDFDAQFFLDCRTNEAEAKAFLASSEVRAQIEAISPFTLLRFGDDYGKLVLSGNEETDYAPERLLACLDGLSNLVAQA